jgi:hypothetical protein
MTMGQVVRRVGVALGCSVLCASCHSLDGRLPVSTSLTGTFLLTAVNGKTLPDTLGELPSLADRPNSCLEIVTRGWLVLDAAAHSFALGRHTQSNSRTLFGSDTIAVGDYRPRRASLRLVTFNGRDSVSIAASVTSTQIMVDDPFNHSRYIFSR